MVKKIILETCPEKNTPTFSFQKEANVAQQHFHHIRSQLLVFLKTSSLQLFREKLCFPL
jgi:hypothetical protein